MDSETKVFKKEKEYISGLPEWKCWVCEERQIAPDALFSPEIGEFLWCLICPSCWPSCEESCLVSELHKHNQRLNEIAEKKRTGAKSIIRSLVAKQQSLYRHFAYYHS